MQLTSAPFNDKEILYLTGRQTYRQIALSINFLLIFLYLHYFKNPLSRLLRSEFLPHGLPVLMSALSDANMMTLLVLLPKSYHKKANKVNTLSSSTKISLTSSYVYKTYSKAVASVTKSGTTTTLKFRKPHFKPNKTEYKSTKLLSLQLVRCLEQETSSVYVKKTDVKQR